VTGRIVLWCGIATALLVGVELMPVHEAHGHHWWHQLPGFDLLYGFAGCVAIILVSKWIGSLWLERPDTFYDDRSRP
jgi:hypothetical protein